jgi:hypothetical protein
MKPILFPEQNTVFAKDQPQYQPLPAFRDSGPEGYVVTCWKLSWRDRLRIVFAGKLWLKMMTYQKPLQPVYLTTVKSEVLETAPATKP